MFQQYSKESSKKSKKNHKQTYRRTINSRNKNMHLEQQYAFQTAVCNLKNNICIIGTNERSGTKIINLTCISAILFDGINNTRMN